MRYDEASTIPGSPFNTAGKEILFSIVTFEYDGLESVPL